jgi:hypothetical protein
MVKSARKAGIKESNAFSYKFDGFLLLILPYVTLHPMVEKHINHFSQAYVC